MKDILLYIIDEHNKKFQGFSFYFSVFKAEKQTRKPVAIIKKWGK